MKIVLLQTDIVWKQADQNRNHIAKMLEDFSGKADIAILPEMFTTGFYMQPQEVAEDENSETLAWMQKLAKTHKMALAGSIAISDEGNYYNRFYFVKPDETYVAYNKKHLFTFGGEKKEYTSGGERVIVEYLGVRMLLQICYDLRFPVFSRNRGDYDMIIYVANWPSVRLYAWNTLIRARAIENVCYVAAVNRTGNDPKDSYSGGSVLLDFMGQAIVENGVEEGAVLGSISMEALKAFREKFPALQDADEFTMIEK